MLGDLEEYVSIAPLGKFAEMDGPSPLVKALGDAGSQRILRKIGGSIMSAHRVTTLAMNNISIPTPGDPGEFGQVTTMRIAPAKAADSTPFIKQHSLPTTPPTNVPHLSLAHL